MAKSAYIGVSSKAKKVKKIYVGVGGKAKKVKKAYIGDANGKAKLFFSSGGIFYYGMGSSSYTSGTYNAENNSFYRVQEWKNDGKIEQITVTNIVSWRASAVWFWNNCWVWVTKRTNYEPYLNIMDKDSFAVTQLTLSGSSTIGIGFSGGMVAGFVVDGNKAYMLFVNTSSASRGYFINIDLANLTYTVTDTNKTNFVAQYDANKSNSLSMLPNGKLLMNHTGYGNGLYVYDQTNNTMTKVTTSGSAAQGFCTFYERARASNRVYCLLKKTVSLSVCEICKVRIVHLWYAVFFLCIPDCLYHKGHVSGKISHCLQAFLVFHYIFRS